jgi:hypothetical protein
VCLRQLVLLVSSCLVWELRSIFSPRSKRLQLTTLLNLNFRPATTAAGGKFVKWLHVWMEDIGIPYSTEALSMGEGNEAARVIGHARKQLTRKVHHIAIQATELQSIIRLGLLDLCRVGSARNMAEHCTKLLPAGAFTPQPHSVSHGLCFITVKHAAIIGAWNQACKLSPA